MEIPQDVRDFMASLDAEIAADIDATRAEIDRTRAMDLAPEVERERLDKLWGEHNLRIRPLRLEKERVVKSLAEIAALEIKPIFIVRGNLAPLG